MTAHTPEPLVVTKTENQPRGYPAALISFRGGRGNGWKVIAPNVSSKAIAAEIAAAYNATYADGINPEAVPDLVEALVLATKELNAIRARDGAPQHIDWDRGKPFQTSSCTDEWWDELTERCQAAISNVKQP